jgi:hypothetical protein
MFLVRHHNDEQGFKKIQEQYIPGPNYGPQASLNFCFIARLKHVMDQAFASSK